MNHTVEGRWFGSCSESTSPHDLVVWHKGKVIICCEVMLNILLFWDVMKLRNLNMPSVISLPTSTGCVSFLNSFVFVSLMTTGNSELLKKSGFKTAIEGYFKK